MLGIFHTLSKKISNFFENTASTLIRDIVLSFALNNSSKLSSKDSEKIIREPLDKLCSYVSANEVLKLFLQVFTVVSDIMQNCYALFIFHSKKENFQTVDNIANVSPAPSPSNPNNNAAETHIVDEFDVQSLYNFLNSFRKSLWTQIQGDICTILQKTTESAFEHKLESFLPLFYSVTFFCHSGEAFSDSDSIMIQNALRKKASAFFMKFHAETLENLKLMIENESWQPLHINDFTDFYSSSSSLPKVSQLFSQNSSSILKTQQTAQEKTKKLKKMSNTNKILEMIMTKTFHILPSDEMISGEPYVDISNKNKTKTQLSEAEQQSQELDFEEWKHGENESATNQQKKEELDAYTHMITQVSQRFRNYILLPPTHEEMAAASQDGLNSPKGAQESEMLLKMTNPFKYASIKGKFDPLMFLSVNSSSNSSNTAEQPKKEANVAKIEEPSTNNAVKIEISGEGNEENENVDQEHPVLTNVSFTLIRKIGEYIEALEILQLINSEVFLALATLIKYYMFAIHSIFGNFTYCKADALPIFNQNTPNSTSSASGKQNTPNSAPSGSANSKDSKESTALSNSVVIQPENDDFYPLRKTNAAFMIFFFANSKQSIQKYFTSTISSSSQPNDASSSSGAGNSSPRGSKSSANQTNSQNQAQDANNTQNLNPQQAASVAAAAITSSLNSNPLFNLKLSDFLQNKLLDPSTGNGVLERIIALETTGLICEIILPAVLNSKVAQSQLIPKSKEKLMNVFLEKLTRAINQERILVCARIARFIFPLSPGISNYAARISNSKNWAITSFQDHHQYVSQILADFGIFSKRMRHFFTILKNGDENFDYTSVSGYNLTFLGCFLAPYSIMAFFWEFSIKACIHEMLEGFSKIKKITNEGKALLSLDIRTFVSGVSQLLDEFFKEVISAPKLGVSLPSPSSLSQQKKERQQLREKIFFSIISEKQKQSFEALKAVPNAQILTNYGAAFFIQSEDAFLEWMEQSGKTDYQLRHVNGILANWESNSKDKKGSGKPRPEFLKQVENFFTTPGVASGAKQPSSSSKDANATKDVIEDEKNDEGNETDEGENEETATAPETEKVEKEKDTSSKLDVPAEGGSDGKKKHERTLSSFLSFNKKKGT